MLKHEDVTEMSSEQRYLLTVKHYQLSGVGCSSVDVLEVSCGPYPHNTHTVYGHQSDVASRPSVLFSEQRGGNVLITIKQS